MLVELSLTTAAAWLGLLCKARRGRSPRRCLQVHPERGPQQRGVAELRGESCLDSRVVQGPEELVVAGRDGDTLWQRVKACPRLRLQPYLLLIAVRGLLQLSLVIAGPRLRPQKPKLLLLFARALFQRRDALLEALREEGRQLFGRDIEASGEGGHQGALAVTEVALEGVRELAMSVPHRLSEGHKLLGGLEHTGLKDVQLRLQGPEGVPRRIGAGVAPEEVRVVVPPRGRGREPLDGGRVEVGGRQRAVQLEPEVPQLGLALDRAGAGSRRRPQPRKGASLLQHRAGVASERRSQASGPRSVLAEVRPASAARTGARRARGAQRRLRSSRRAVLGSIAGRGDVQVVLEGLVVDEAALEGAERSTASRVGAVANEPLARGMQRLRLGHRFDRRRQGAGHLDEGAARAAVRRAVEEVPLDSRLLRMRSLAGGSRVGRAPVRHALDERWLPHEAGNGEEECQAVTRHEVAPSHARRVP
mmetsp:Transcript_1892/g.5660  ORF Transcript_1892/g.5660 Transcript_1892/m.5660 type:complete len:476 (+) Transcript_1892:489-1916(+)